MKLLCNFFPFEDHKWGNSTYGKAITFFVFDWDHENEHCIQENILAV
jgi:hypothetical protein